MKIIRFLFSWIMRTTDHKQQFSRLGKEDVPALALCVLFFACFAWTVSWKSERHQQRQLDEMSVAMPATIQLGFALGDRYLAANMGVFRSQTIGTHDLQADTYAALAKVQLVTAQLNPKHEDNYYTAAAILPWNGQLDAGQLILSYATAARTQDATPPFFRGFNKYYFQRDYVGGGQDLLLAADRSEGGNANGLRSIASHWFEKGYEPSQARNMINAMAKTSTNPRLTGILNARAARLDGLIALQAAAKKFKETTGHPLGNLDDLVRLKLIEQLPNDPFGLGYVVDKEGVPQLARPSSSKK